MKTRLHLLIVFVVLSLGASLRAYGHHPLGSVYDLNQTLGIQGKVLEFALRNPHSYFSIEVISKDGTKAVWGAEWGKTSEMSQIGVVGSTFKVGDAIAISGFPTIVRDRALLIRSVTRASDGRRWDLQTR